MSTLQKFNQTITKPATQDYLASVLGEKKMSFVNNLTALVANNEALQACEPVSIMYAAMKATALDLPLDQNLGFAYVIPFKDNKKGVTVAQFQIGKNGFVQLALRTGVISALNCGDVREGEIESNDFLTGELTFKRLKENRLNAKIIGYFAFLRLNNGFSKMMYMTIEEVKAHGMKYSQTYKRGFGPWKDDFNSMAEKTVLKRLLSKWGPLSVENSQLNSAIKYDQAVFENEEQIQYVDNEPIIEIKAEPSILQDSQVPAFIEMINSGGKTIDQLKQYYSLTPDQEIEIKTKCELI